MIVIHKGESVDLREDHDVVWIENGGTAIVDPDIASWTVAWEPNYRRPWDEWISGGGCVLVNMRVGWQPCI